MVYIISWRYFTVLFLFFHLFYFIVFYLYFMWVMLRELPSVPQLFFCNGCVWQGVILGSHFTTWPKSLHSLAIFLEPWFINSLDFFYSPPLELSEVTLACTTSYNNSRFHHAQKRQPTNLNIASFVHTYISLWMSECENKLFMVPVGKDLYKGTWQKYFF